MGATIFFFPPFSLFVSVYAYASVCDFVCIALFLPFVLGFCLSVFCFVILYSFQCLLSLVDLFFGLVVLLFLSFFLIT